MVLKSVKLSSLDQRYGELRLTDPVALRRLRESVQREGMHSPVLVSEGVEAGKLVLVDGFKRVRIAEERGEAEILARLESLDDADAHAAVLACNRPSRGVSDLEEAWVVRSLHRVLRMPQVRIGTLLGRHKSWVCRRLRLVEALEEDLQEEIRLGLLSGSMARELTRLPRGNQEPAARSIRDHGLSTRQASRLVGKVLESADPKARQALLADPLRYVAAEQPEDPAPVRDPRLSDRGNELRDCLLALQGKVWRLILLCRTHAPAGLTPADAEVLVPLITESIEKVSRGLDAMKRLLADSERRTDGVTEAPGVRGGPAPQAGRVEARDRPGAGHRPEDGPPDPEESQEARGGRRECAGAGGDLRPHTEGLEAGPLQGADLGVA